MPTVKDIAVKRNASDWVTNPKGHKKRIWFSFDKNGFIYLSYDGDRFPGRTYWVLSRLPRKQRPTLRFADRTQTLWINTYGVRFQHAMDYVRAKKALIGFARLA